MRKPVGQPPSKPPDATSRHPNPPDRTQQHRPAPAINPSPSAAPAAVWNRRKLLENAAVLADFPTSVSPLSGHQISRAPEVQSTRSRDFRRVQLARTISLRSAQDPPPGHP
ncbi:hypothetical protein Prudu_011626 [Prunus dulcis]|uniref:F-box family protein with DUF295 n=1 Tax=Prunus dulcis TaxID=3755 RepID=A0A4Y1RBL6_PRUDU|nr:hypothetical protein Prudu_011626 [Prunus dulcis]